MLFALLYFEKLQPLDEPRMMRARRLQRFVEIARIEPRDDVTVSHLVAHGFVQRKNAPARHRVGAVDTAGRQQQPLASNGLWNLDNAGPDQGACQRDPECRNQYRRAATDDRSGPAQPPIARAGLAWKRLAGSG